jgi:hypothetical protein
MNTPPTLEEAAKSLTADLVKYVGRDGWQCVGMADEPNNPHLIIYTSTRARANQLLAFIGYKHEGFKVIGRALGRVTLCGRP